MAQLSRRNGLRFSEEARRKAQQARELNNALIQDGKQPAYKVWTKKQKSKK